MANFRPQIFRWLRLGQVS